MKKILAAARESLIPAILTFLLFSGVLLIKGIWPFGQNLIDYYDMGQTNAPLYYHIWDFLHGKSPLFFDWYINLGQNLSMGSAIQWNISPFNLFYLFIPRDWVYISLSVFMGLHLMFMAFNMGLFLRLSFPELRKSFTVPAAMCYGLCGYTLTHYTIPTYLDTAVFLPLFALSLLMMLRGGGKLFYTLMLGFMTALSYYLGFMHLIYVLLFSLVYIMLILKDPTEKKKVISDLAVGTAGGLLLSSFMLLPSVMEMTLSSRFNSNLSGGPVDTLISILNSVGADQYYVKYLQLFAMEIFIMVIILGLIHFRKDLRYVLTVFFAAFIPCALIVFEAINILWHFGTYYHYPIRCAYLIPFSVIAAAASLTERAGKEDGVLSVNIKSVAAMSLISLAALLLIVKFYNSRAPWDIKELFKYWVLLAAAILVMSTIVCLILRFRSGLKGGKLIHSFFILILPITVAELMLGAYAGYGLPKFTDTFFGDPEQSGDYILKTEALSDVLSGHFTEEDGFYRINRLKNPDTDLNANYGMVWRHGSVAGWANTATGEMINTAEKLGYSTHFMRILDSGGTILSDSVLQVKELLTSVSLPEGADMVYSPGEQVSTVYGVYGVFKNEVPLPFIMQVSDEILKFDPENRNIAENNNTLYMALSGDSEGIAEQIKLSEDAGRSGDAFIIPVTGKKALYLYKGHSDTVRVNGETVSVPTIGDLDNTEYPGWFNSNLLFLGIYEEGEVKLECSEKSRLIIFDVDKMTALSHSMGADGNSAVETTKSGLSFSFSGKGSRILIPLAYSPGWSAKVNGEKRAVENRGGLFMTLPVETGENRVEMKFTPPGLIPGIAVSIITLIIVVMLTFIKDLREKGENLLSALSPVVSVLFYIASAAAVIALYIIPIGWFVVNVLIHRLLGR